MTFLLTCKEFLQELTDYLDSTVDAELRLKLEAHISECPNCFVILDTTQKTIRVYKGIEPLTPEDVAEVIVWVASRPDRVNIARVVLTTVRQANSLLFHRDA